MSEPKYTDEDLKRVAGIKDEMFNDQIQVVLEAVSDLQDQVSHLPTREEFNELKADMKVVKAAVTDTSRQLQDHERRITNLEARA